MHPSGWLDQLAGTARPGWRGQPTDWGLFFPQALLAGFSFRTGEHKAFAVRKIAATPEKVWKRARKRARKRVRKRAQRIKINEKSMKNQ